MLNRVITISREFGSGGRTIGKKVAEKLGIPCYDAELIQKIAEESGYTHSKRFRHYAQSFFVQVTAREPGPMWQATLSDSGSMSSS